MVLQLIPFMCIIKSRRGAESPYGPVVFHCRYVELETFINQYMCIRKLIKCFMQIFCHPHEFWFSPTVLYNGDIGIVKLLLPTGSEKRGVFLMQYFPRVKAWKLLHYDYINMNKVG